MKFNPIPYNVGLIDSLTIYLPLDKIQVIDERLISEYQVYYPETGEIIEDLNPPKPILIKDNGINFRFNRVVFPPNIIKKETTELIRLTLTSKMLFGRYFEGINIDNLQMIVDYINTRQIIRFDLDTALNSICNDIDICINYNLDFEPYKQSLQYLKKMVKASKQHEVTLYPRKETFKNDKNYGIEFSNRDSAKIGSPFCKFYNKTEELLTNSADFYNKYLFPQLRYGLSIDNIIRKEITIKNNAVKQNLRKKKLVNSENQLSTLKDVLSISQTELTTICNVQLKYYYEKKQFSISSDLSPTDKIISYYMHKLVELGADKLTLQEPLTLFDCKVQKARTKKQILKLIDITFDTEYLTKQLEQNSITNQFIKMQNLW